MDEIPGFEGDGMRRSVFDGNHSQFVERASTRRRVWPGFAWVAERLRRAGARSDERGVRGAVAEVLGVPGTSADGVLEIANEPLGDVRVPVPRAEPVGQEPAAEELDPLPVELSVFGPPRVFYRPPAGGRAVDITSAFQPRTREVLVLLALSPAGVLRDVLVERLWAETSIERPTNALNTAVTRLRRSVSHATQGAVTDLISLQDGVYRLDPAVVQVDYWRFADAVAASRSAPSEQARIAAYHRVVHSYGGPLAEGLVVEWLEVDRESTRRDALDAVAALARALVGHDPQQTLDLLEVAIAFDPYNELLYRDIMRLQERLGRLDAISRTMTLLATRLKEIDADTMPQTVDLAARLQQCRDVPAGGGSHA